VTLDVKNGQPPEYISKVEILAQALLKNRGLIFLGAGASRPDDGQESLPTAGELAQEMADACRLPFPAYLPLSTIAFYYESRYNRPYLNGFLQKKIDRDDLPIPTTMQLVAEIAACLEEHGRQCFIVTTNYDCFIERAYEARMKKKPTVIVYRGGWNPHDSSTRLHVGFDGDAEFWHPTQSTTIYKMHGCIKDVTEATQNESCLVITDEDYINFITNAFSQDDKKRLLQYTRGVIALSNILFLGYSLTDSNFRVIFKATAEARKNDSYAIQYLNGNKAAIGQFELTRWTATASFWQTKKVQIIDAHARDFVAQLLSEIRRQIGNVGH